MKLLQQILSEAGFDLGSSVTWVPHFGVYFKGVKRVEEFSEEVIVVIAAKRRWVITGEKLSVDKYFEQDLLVRGEIKEISCD